MLRFRPTSALACLALASCGGTDDLPSVAPQQDAGQGEASDAYSAPDLPEGGVASSASAYGIFQLYGDEYSEFRQAMSFSLQDYWGFVDQHVAKLHVHFTRANTLLIWGIVEPELGNGFVWNSAMQTDDVIGATYAPAAGKQMDTLLVIEPSRGKQGDPPFPTGLEAEYQNYVRNVVERYDGDGNDDVNANARVKHWQVMNEPFFALDAGDLTSSQYAELVKLTSQAVRDADPEARVVLGDLGKHIKEVVPLLAQAGAFDAIDLHYWSSGTNYQLQTLSNVRASLDANGYSHAEIWMCEFGSTRNSAVGAGAVPTASDQARWLVKAMVANRAAGVSRILWNNLAGWTNFAGNPSSPFNFMGLVSSGASSGDDPSMLGKETVAYFAFQRLVAETEPSVAQLQGEISGMPAGVRAFEWTTRSAQSFFVAWSDQAATQASFPCSSATARIVKLVPDANGVFEEQIVAVDQGKAACNVGLDPVLIQAVE